MKLARGCLASFFKYASLACLLKALPMFLTPCLLLNAQAAVLSSGAVSLAADLHLARDPEAAWSVQ